MKKSEIFSLLPLDFFPENSIIGFTLETTVKTKNREEKQKPARLLGRLKESEMCLVTAQEKFLGSQIYGKQDRQFEKSMKSLILAQNERWWRVLYMQVERGSNAERRTGE